MARTIMLQRVADCEHDKNIIRQNLNLKEKEKGQKATKEEDKS